MCKGTARRSESMRRVIWVLWKSTQDPKWGTNGSHKAEMPHYLKSANLRDTS
uniref:Uncharacterized protein n=1 Tax=Rhizophora mucronata TaxID=61149 RepID=A0A2P2Q3Z9_RHIMU